MDEGQKLRHGDRLLLLGQAENAGVLVRDKHQILLQLPAPAAGVADLLAQHQRGLAGAQLFLHPAALDVLRQQLGVQPRRLQGDRRLRAQQADHARVLGGKHFRHQPVFQVQHAHQPRLFEHRDAHDRRPRGHQIRVLTEGMELLRPAGADLLPGADHRRQHRQRQVGRRRHVFEDPHPHAVGAGPGAGLDLRNQAIAHAKQQPALRPGAFEEDRHQVFD